MFHLFGVPGCGKTTQAQILKDKGYFYISAGELVRKKASKEMLKEATQGKLVDHDYVNELVVEELEEVLKEYPSNKIILDGYPRVLYQAKWLYEDYKADLAACIFIDIDLSEAISRIQARGRNDDTLDSIKQRIESHKKYAEELLLYYDASGIEVKIIEGHQAPEQVALEIEEVLKQIEEFS